VQRIPPRAKTQEPLKRTGFFKRKLQHYVTLACRAKASHRAQLTGLPKVEGDTSAQVVVGHSSSGIGSPAAHDGWKYTRARMLKPGATVSPLAAPAARIAVADLLP